MESSKDFNELFKSKTNNYVHEVLSVSLKFNPIHLTNKYDFLFGVSFGKNAELNTRSEVGFFYVSAKRNPPRRQISIWLPADLINQKLGKYAFRETNVYATRQI